jgi:hypothetical protein
MPLPTRNLDTNPLPGLGRLISFDPRDANHPLGAAAPLKVTRSSMMWETPAPMNQGPTFECTAYSAEHFLMSAPVKNNIYLTPNQLYKLNQLNDEWPGENYSGSSVRAAFKVLQAAGFISEYAWATDADTARRWVLMNGPVVFGTNWYANMMTPNKTTGFIRASGKAVGGHAYMIRGADDTIKCPDGSTGAFRVFNSWGEQWGQQGKAWLSYKEGDGLIKNHGECCTALEQFSVTPKIITGVLK